MKKMCESYRVRNKIDMFDGVSREEGYCISTKELECCNCGGDETKCDFYSYIRERAKKPAVNVLTYSPSSGCAQKIYINPAILMERLINRSIKEERELPWWVCQEIYNFNNKGE